MGSGRDDGRACQGHGVYFMPLDIEKFILERGGRAQHAAFANHLVALTRRTGATDFVRSYFATVFHVSESTIRNWEYFLVSIGLFHSRLRRTGRRSRRTLRPTPLLLRLGATHGGQPTTAHHEAPMGGNPPGQPVTPKERREYATEGAERAAPRGGVSSSHGNEQEPTRKTAGRSEADRSPSSIVRPHELLER